MLWGIDVNSDACVPEADVLFIDLSSSVYPIRTVKCNLTLVDQADTVPFVEMCVKRKTKRIKLRLTGVAVQIHQYLSKIKGYFYFDKTKHGLRYERFMQGV